MVRRQRGFSLFEVVIALAILATALAALAPLFIQCTILVDEAAAETRALALASSRLEQLAALRFEEDASTLTQVIDEQSDLSQLPPSSGGGGLRAGSAATAWTDATGFSDWTDDERGLVAALDRRATFVRRWSVTALPPPGDGRVLQAFARRRALEEREAPRSTPAHRRGDVWLFTLRGLVMR